MSKQITWIKLEVEFDKGFVGTIELEDMELSLADLKQFLEGLSEPIERLSQFGKSTEVKS